MRSKTLSYLLSRSTNRNKESNQMLDSNRVKVDIENLCSQHLEQTGDIIQFEVNNNDLDYVISIVESDSLNNYHLFQIDKSLFGASLREIDLL